MKKYLLNVLMTSLALFLSSSLSAQHTFVLKGKVGRWSAPAKIFLNYEDNGQQVIDSVTIDKGYFEYQGEVSRPSIANIRLSPDGSHFNQSQYHYESTVLLTKGTINIQGEDLASATSKVVVTSDTTKKNDRNVKISIGKSDDESKKKKIQYPRTFGGITFSRIDWGFSRPIQGGSFTMSGDNEFMQYGRASNFGFDVAQFGVRFNDNFKVYASAGFEWNYMRLKNNVLLHQGEPPLDYTPVDPDEVNYRKNVLTSTYLRTPLSFEWRSNRNDKGKRAKVAFGAMTGFLLKGSQRLKSNEQGKQGFKDNFNLQSFQYGGFVRIGYGSMGVFAKYYINDMFENSPAQEGMNNFAFGLTLGF